MGVDNDADSVDDVSGHSDEGEHAAYTQQPTYSRVDTIDSTTPTRDLPKRAATIPQQAEILLVDHLLSSQHIATNTAQSVSTGISDPPSREWEAWSSQTNFYMWGQRKLRQAVEKLCIQTKQGKQQINLQVTSIYYQMSRATRMKRLALLMIIYNRHEQKLKNTTRRKHRSRANGSTEYHARCGQ